MIPTRFHISTADVEDSDSTTTAVDQVRQRRKSLPHIPRLGFPLVTSCFSRAWSWPLRLFPTIIIIESSAKLSFRIPAAFGGRFCSCVTVLRPLHSTCEPASMGIPFACCSLSCTLALISYIFLLFLPFSAFDSDVVCFILSVFFLWLWWCCLLGHGFCRDSFIQHMIRIYLIRTYADITVLFLSEVPVYH